MSRRLIVVGAGIIGGSIAWRAARRGWRVTLIDAGAFAGESSWAGAGMLTPAGEFDSPSVWTQAAVESLAAYPEYVRELSEESCRLIDFRREGAMELAFGDDEAAALEVRAGAQAGLGMPSEPAEWGGTPGRFFPLEAAVEPRDVTAALRTALERAGATIREHEPVIAIEDHAVATARERLTADAVVLAAGAWSSLIRCGAPVPEAYPVRGHLLGYRAPKELLGPIVRHGHTYLVQRTNGWLIAGASTERAGFDRSVDGGTVRDLAARAEALLPELARYSPPEAWVGFRPGAAEPVVERAGESPLWLAYGHYRNGILLAPWTAARIVTSIEETL